MKHFALLVFLSLSSMLQAQVGGISTVPGMGHGKISAVPGTGYFNLHLPEPTPPKNRQLQDAIGYAAFTLAGISNGFNQAWVAEPDLFGEGAGFAEKESWKRKYDNFDNGDLSAAYPGSKSVLVFTTDLFHLTSAVTKAGLVGGTICVTLGEPFSFKKTGKRLVIGGILYGLASDSTYRILR